MENNQNENFFGELAKAYVENDGASLRQEQASLPYSPALKKRIKNKLFTYKVRYYSLRVFPFAAVFLLFVLVYKNIWINRQPPATESTTPGTMAADQPDWRNTVSFISLHLPAGYTVKGIDYDNQATIMSITNTKNNTIILTMEAYTPFDSALFTDININGSTVYGLVKNDYSQLKYGKDGLLYTLTSPYDYQDLIEICEEII